MNKVVRMMHVDGKLPNLALMKLSHWHKAQGDEVHFTRGVARELFDKDPDIVYASAIFSASRPKLDRIKKEWPAAVIGGTASGSSLTVEDILGEGYGYEHYDYSIYPGYEPSLGFTQRGCRLRCEFCVVPEKEGRPRAINTIADIHRGGGYKTHIVLLDNDFFGQPKADWKARAQELRDGDYKVCFTQGINIRLVDQEAAECLSSLRYYEDQFARRQLYTAFDSIKDEKIFFRGVDLLQAAGVRPEHLMVYMLTGYEKDETWNDIFRRFDMMTDRGIRPYPMVYMPPPEDAEKYKDSISRKELKKFQRWVVMRHYEFVPWEKYTHKRESWDRAGDLDEPLLFTESAV